MGYLVRRNLGANLVEDGLLHSYCLIDELLVRQVVNSGVALQLADDTRGKTMIITSTDTNTAYVQAYFNGSMIMQAEIRSSGIERVVVPEIATDIDFGRNARTMSCYFATTGNYNQVMTIKDGTDISSEMFKNPLMQNGVCKRQVFKVDASSIGKDLNVANARFYFKDINFSSLDSGNNTTMTVPDGTEWLLVSTTKRFIESDISIKCGSAIN